jgi:hypothetical protein
MTWTAALLALLVSHVVGDVVLQTEWQAATKVPGLRRPDGRRALLSHVLTYMVAFIPALIWIGTKTSAGRGLAVAALVAVPHLLVDDGSLVRAWLRDVKRNPAPTQALMIATDQSFHLVCLLGAALLAAA